MHAEALSAALRAGRGWHFYVCGATSGEAVQRQNVDFHGCEERVNVCIRERLCMCLLGADMSRH